MGEKFVMASVRAVSVASSHKNRGAYPEDRTRDPWIRSQVIRPLDKVIPSVWRRLPAYVKDTDTVFSDRIMKCG
ncbi:hypothetical protein TNCV_4658641 [Trichonephila clavipes]|nr:hypothetical protein TNCV_4658641 [Trichonephila clavipes]